MAEQLMRAQLKGSTTSINSTAGYKGVLVLNTDTNHLHILTGEAGSNIELANKTDIPAPIDISGKADITYVDQQLATKQPIGDYATNSALTSGLSTKLDNTAKALSASVADVANSVAWVNVTGKENVRTTDIPITIADFGTSVDFGMIGE